MTELSRLVLLCVCVCVRVLFSSDATVHFDHQRRICLSYYRPFISVHLAPYLMCLPPTLTHLNCAFIFVSLKLKTSPRPQLHSQTHFTHELSFHQTFRNDCQLSDRSLPQQSYQIIILKVPAEVHMAINSFISKS